AQASCISGSDRAVVPTRRRRGGSCAPAREMSAPIVCGQGQWSDWGGTLWPMANPSGTVTFLFTDIEGSTRLWQADEAVMREATSRHDQLLGDVVANHGGVVFSTMGDGLGAAFQTASAAVGCAVEAQRQLDQERWGPAIPIKVRMGLHTGEAQLRDGD